MNFTFNEKLLLTSSTKKELCRESLKNSLIKL